MVLYSIFANNCLSDLGLPRQITGLKFFMRMVEMRPGCPNSPAHL